MIKRKQQLIFGLLAVLFPCLAVEIGIELGYRIFIAQVLVIEVLVFLAVGLTEVLSKPLLELGFAPCEGVVFGLVLLLGILLGIVLNNPLGILLGIVLNNELGTALGTGLVTGLIVLLKPWPPLILE